MANAYYYAPRYRPPGYSALPQGYAIVATGKYYDLPLTMFDRPPASNMPFGVVVYRRKLSADEVERHELDRVELVTGWPTPVPTVTKWKKLRPEEQVDNQQENFMDGRPVVVTTAHRGVFFGYATNTDGETITLRRGRNCNYWSPDVKGFMALASHGPSAHCRISPAADITLRNITAVIEVTPEAAAKWEEAPWSS